MISAKELALGPLTGEYLPFASDNQIRARVEKPIKKVIEKLRTPLRYVPELISGDDFLGIQAGQTSKFFIEGKRFQADPDHMQQVALEVMGEYGFDETHIRKTKVEDHGETASEYTYYPSKNGNNRGLEFVRTKHYYTSSNQPYAVWWSVTAAR